MKMSACKPFKQIEKSEKMVTLVVVVNALSRKSNTNIMLPNMQSALTATRKPRVTACVKQPGHGEDKPFNFFFFFFFNILNRLIFHLDFADVSLFAHKILWTLCNLLQNVKIK